MRYESAAAFRAALEQRLKSSLAGGGPSIQRARKRIAFERLLARLASAAPDQWLLKGGFALELRLGEGARTTKDVDIDWREPEREAAEALLTAAATDLADFFDFEIERLRTAPDVGGAASATARLPPSRGGSSTGRSSISALPWSQSCLPSASKPPGFWCSQA